MIAKRINKANKSIFLSWVVAYVSILIIPLVISSIAYYESGRVLEREISRANESLLNQVKHIMDSNLRELKRLSMELDYNSEVQTIMNSDLDVEEWRRYNVVKLVQNLRVYNISNDFINDIYIFFKKSEIVVTPTGSNDDISYYEINYKNDGMALEEWSKITREKYNGVIIPVDLQNENSIDKKMLFIKSLPILEPKESYANLIITINDTFFKESIRNIKWLEKGNVIILNSKNQVLLSTNNEEDFSYIRFDEMKESNGIIHREVNGRDVMLAYNSSKESDWKYISVIPSSVFWEKAQYVRKFTIISILFCIILGGLAAFFFLYKNYKPISELTYELASQSGIGFNSGSNEYSFIREAVSKTLKEKERIAFVLEQQRSAQRSNFIYKLLKGRLDGLPYIHESLSFFDIHFASDSFVVILLQISDYSNVFFHSDDLDTVEKLKATHLVLTNVIEEIVGRKNQGFMTEIDGMMACLINLKQSEMHNIKTDLHEAISEAQSFIMNKFNIHFTAAMSDVHNTIFGITEAYQEAAQAMEYKQVMGIKTIVSYEEIPQEDNTVYYYPLEMEQRLINYIRAGEFLNAQEIIESIFNSNFANNKISLKLTKYFIYDIVSTILKLSSEFNTLLENDVKRKLNKIDKILEGKSLEEGKGEILDILKKLCDSVYILKQSKNKNNELINGVVEFIQNNYKDECLNISAIAENFNLSPDYLSKLFKTQTEESMLDFINKVRIQRAKELLMQKEETVSNIAKETGFANVNTFIRIFKKQEGLTPGQYRALDIPTQIL